MVMISLTPAGETLIKEVLPVQIFAIVEELAVLSPEEQQILGELCKKLGLGNNP
jgi:MarR family 2-MHQ and catechol resistance regulon transcriptional repressor